MEVTSREERVERWVPGLRTIRGYQRPWLRRDVVAGVVLAAILIPQGMAYAQLAGLPAVTGLYTTVACLVGYAIFGPSRVLVLGPDSSISPLILAAITPLLAGGDAGTAIALAGMLAVLVGLTEIGLGLGKLGFVADLLSKEVQVGYMNGLAVTIIVGQLPKLFGFSTSADSFLAEVRAFFDGLDGTDAATLAVGLGVFAVLLITAPDLAAGAGGARGGGGRDRALGGAEPGRSRRRHRRLAPAGGSDAEPAVDQRERHPGAPDRGDRHHARVAHRHDRDGRQLRRQARRRGRARPGDDRDGRREHRRRPVPGLRRLDQRLPHGGRRAVGCQEPGDWPRRRGARGRAAPVPELAARGPAPDRPRRGRDRGGALADRRGDPPSLPRDPPERLLGLADGERRRDPARRAAGDRRCGRDRDPAVLPAQLVAARGRARARLRGGGLARRRLAPRCRAAAGHRRLPLGGAAVLRQRRRIPPADPQAGARAQTDVDRPAVRGDHRRGRDGRRDARGRSTTS